MLITRASEYALLTLIEISHEKQPIKAQELSKRLSISQSFLAKILQNLAKDNVLRSYRGSSGGFMLDKELEDITIMSVIRSVEGTSPSVFDCSSSIDCCPNSVSSCQIWPFLNRLQNKIDNFLDELTLQDLV
ncbi:MAG: RrF2 family transcriptional regulator [Campylobacterota bacterium]